MAESRVAMNLDDLIADAVKRKEVKAPKRAAKTKAAIKRTAEEMRFATLERCIPESVHLHTTNQLCKCGARYEAVNNIPLVKCVGISVTHFRPEEDLTDFSKLPIFVETRLVEIPYCAACLTGATFITLEPEDEPIHIKNSEFKELYDTIYSTGIETYVDDEDR